MSEDDEHNRFAKQGGAMGSGGYGEKGQPRDVNGKLNGQNNSMRVGPDAVMRETGDGADRAVAPLAAVATRDRRGGPVRAVSAGSGRGYTIGGAGGMSRQATNDGIGMALTSGAVAGAAAGMTGRDGDHHYDHENICHRCGRSLEDCQCEEGPLYYYEVTLEKIRSRQNRPN